MTIKIRDLQNLEQIECVDLTDKEMQLISGGLFNGEKGFKLNGFITVDVVSHGGSGNNRLSLEWG
jgi:bacteriocin-like protein